jgi:ribosomal protein L16 Arg81 hydroxylase
MEILMTQMDIVFPSHATAAQEEGEAQLSAASSRFLDTVTLRTLVSPITEQEFLSRHWEKKPLIVNRKIPAYYGDLFSLRDFDNAASRASSYVKVAEATTKKQVRHHGSGAISKERILADMREGASLILDHVQQYDEKLGLLCSKLSQQLGFLFQTNLYLTPPNGKGFLPHWDNHDVFVLQVLGSKHWKVERDRRLLPEKDANIADEDRCFQGEVISFTLEQGDMVYIPRGFVHAAECGSENSLHITLGIYPFTWDDLLAVVIKAAVLRDERLRLALPLGHIRIPRREIVGPVMDALRDMLDRDFLDQVVDQYRNETIKKFPLDISGQVASFFQPTPWALGDRAGPRDGIVYTTSAGEGTVSVYVGTRVITFPDFFAEALEFALNKPVYQVRDLPGDMEDEERLAVIERLMLEGLVVRK